MHALDVTSIQAEVLFLALQIFPQFESFSKYEDMERSFSRVGCTEIHFPFVLIIIIANLSSIVCVGDTLDLVFWSKQIHRNGFIHVKLTLLALQMLNSAAVELSLSKYRHAE